MSKLSSAKTLKIFPVILSGGIGTRLWPMSREAHPKQFLGLNDKHLTLMQETVDRVAFKAGFQKPIIVCNADHRFLVAEQLKLAGVTSAEIIIEPKQRNTAPAIAAAALYIKEKYGDGLMLVLPSDHIIKNTREFIEATYYAAEFAEKGNLVTFGIKPEYAETGYGYIKTGKTINGRGIGFTVECFTEKPDLKTAESFVEAGNYLWNSGMFMFPTDTLISELRQYQPYMLNACEASIIKRKDESDFIKLDEASYLSATSISIDYALMEKTDKAAVVAIDCGWSDAGSWDSLWRISEKDEAENVIIGENFLNDTKGCYVRSEEGPAVATLGVEDLIIVSTKDSVLVAHKDRAQDIKKLVDTIKEQRPELVTTHRRVYRPWGAYDSIDFGDRHQVKRITVRPGGKLSLQMHYHRAEHWIVVAGTAKVTCDGVETVLSENQSIYIPCGVVHRIENPGKIALDIIEVQSGSYLGEDDIVRFEDVYGRSDEVDSNAHKLVTA